MEAAQAGQVIQPEKSIDIITVPLEHHDIKLIYLGKHLFSPQHYSIPHFPAHYFSPRQVGHDNVKPTLDTNNH